MVPRIQEANIREQRAMRQRQLIDAAMSLALEGGVNAVTVASVAKRAGLSRSSIYEYFSSSADLIADLVLEELENYNNRLQSSVAGIEEPYLYLELWIKESLQYVIDGRHILVKSLNSVNTPNFRKSEIALGHKRLVASMKKPFESLGIKDIGAALSYLQSAIDSAAQRIEAGAPAELELQLTQKFVIGGIRALAS
ncbi:DNA-binding HTH domain, TetR-type [actinobacterium SCGC AAA044-D11]